jgi:catechol 2,3-dioxygenase-like lactoylglutathione lyase family enzyme
MAKVTGIGGVFFKAKSDPKVLGAWYRDNLGMKLEDFGGAILRWTDDHAEDRGVTVWHLAKPDSEWFNGGFMINYRVDDMAGLIEQLRRNDVAIVKGPEFHENGAFAWIMDPDGNKIELWEPKLWDDKNKR